MGTDIIILGKGNRCYELEMFRYFRDNWLVYEEDGEAKGRLSLRKGILYKDGKGIKRKIPDRRLNYEWGAHIKSTK